MECIKTDTTSLRGERAPQNGDLSTLVDFNFNESALLDSILSAPFTTTINRTTGAVGLSVPAFNPTVLLAAPQQATHFRILLGASAVDFTTGEVEEEVTESADMAITNALTTALNLSASLAANNTKLVLALVAVRFFIETNGVKYPLHSNNPLAIVAPGSVRVNQKATARPTRSGFCLWCSPIKASSRTKRSVTKRRYGIP